MISSIAPMKTSPSAPRRCRAKGPACLGVAALLAAFGGASARAADTGGDVIVVALDPGHGGTNLGAASPVPGIYEKNVTLALAERVRALLEADVPADAPAPRFKVVLCRTDDRLVAIRARARCAEQSGARLFLSLHANAVPAGVTPGAQHGFEVFVLGPREVDDDAAVAALHGADDSDAVWRAHVVHAAGERAVALAHLVDEALARALGADARRGVKQAGAALDVLRGAGTPAALVEVGFLDHPQEGARLASASGREPIAQALATAVRAFVGSAGVPPIAAGIRPRQGQKRLAAPSSRGQLHARLQAQADEATHVTTPTAPRSR